MAQMRELVWDITTNAKTKAINDVNKGMDKLKDKAKQVDTGIAMAGKSMQDFSKKNAAAASKFGKKWGKSLSAMGSKMTKRITMPLAALGTAGTKMYMDLDTNIKKVTTLADKDVLPVDKIQKEVREISDASGIAQAEIADAAYSALSAGVESEKVMEFVRSGIDLTRAGFTDMDTAIDATTTVLNAYGDNAFEVGKIHDIFVQTQDKGKISVDELGKSIGRVVPTASSLGVNMDQLGASYAILTAKGQNAQLATTNLNALLGELGKTGSTSDKILRKKTGKSFKELTKEGKNTGEVLEILNKAAKASNLELADMFGSTSAVAAANTLLSDGVEGYTNMLNDMNNATGKTSENAQTMMTDAQKVNIAVTQVKNTLMDAGAVIAPFVTQAAEYISTLVGKFNELDEGTKVTILKIAGVAMAVGPALTGVSKLIGPFVRGGNRMIGFIGKIVALIGKLGLGAKITSFTSIAVSGLTKVASFLIGPWGLAITAAVAGGVLLYKNWDTIKQKASEVGASIGNKLSEMGEKWSETKTKLGERIDARVEMIKTGYDNGVNAVKNSWNNLKSKLSETIKSRVGMIKSAFDNGVSSVKEKWDKLKNFLAHPIQGTVGLVQKGWEKVKGRVSSPKTDGSFRTGINEIPRDNFVGNMHKGEMVLTQQTANEYRALGGTKDKLPTPINNTTSTTTSNSQSINPNITINVNGSEGSPTDIARAIKRELNQYFKELSIQGV